MANDTAVNVNKPGDGRAYENIDTSKTLAAADSGVVQNIVADAQTITLPATVVGYYFIIRNGGVPKTSSTKGSGDNGSVLITIAPNASDNITGGGFTGVDNKTYTNTKATANVGDELQIVGDGVNGWMITKEIGTWVKQA